MPSGRLPVTFYRSDRDLPPFTDYSMKDRTYKYFQGEPLYPFAHGLSYTSFALEDLRFDGGAVEGVLRNTGSRRGGHAIPVFLKDPGDRSVNCRLAGLTRLELDHTAPTPVGMTVTCESELTAVEGRKLVFAVKLRDETGPVGGGVHERFIVNDQKFAAKARAKKG